MLFLGPSFLRFPFPYNLATIISSAFVMCKLEQMFPFPVANNSFSLLFYMFLPSQIDLPVFYCS